MQRVLGRMGTAVHPDGALGAPREVVGVDGDELLGIAIKPKAATLKKDA